MLSIAIVCIAAGWCVDRSIQDRRTKTLVDAAIAYGRSTDHHLMGNLRLNHMNPDAVADLIDGACAGNILSLYENSAGLDNLAKYDLELAPDPNVLRMTKESLNFLRCRTADSFFDKLELSDNFTFYEMLELPSPYEKYIDPSTLEHTELRLFIDDALNSLPHFVH